MAQLLEMVTGLEGVRRIVYELGRGRAIDNTRREIEATRIAIARVEALARRVPPSSGESSPDVALSA
jgi:hypothetical protein